jgi:AraC family transcriptional regulator, ethanolamine operon transcriptional activator
MTTGLNSFDSGFRCGKATGGVFAVTTAKQAETADIVRATFDDVDEFCSTVGSWDLDFQPLGGPCVGTSTAQLTQFQVAGVEFGRARISVNLEQRGSAPPGAVTFVVLENSMRRLWWRGHDVDSSHILVFPVGSELYSLSGGDFHIYTVSVSPEDCEAIFDAHKLKGQSLAALPQTFRPDIGVLATLRTSLRLITKLASPPSAFEGQVITDRLVSAWAQAGGAPVENKFLGSRRLQLMRQILERFENDDWIDLTPRKLCADMNISERTLQYVFKDRFGMSPAKFLKARRLAAVRYALECSDNGTPTVANVAVRHHFQHTGQFAADYWRAFGELPSDTLRRGAGDKR